jgi:hypothetical protein
MALTTMSSLTESFASSGPILGASEDVLLSKGGVADSMDTDITTKQSGSVNKSAESGGVKNADVVGIDEKMVTSDDYKGVSEPRVGESTEIQAMAETEDESDESDYDSVLLVHG